MKNLILSSLLLASQAAFAGKAPLTLKGTIVSFDEKKIELVKGKDRYILNNQIIGIKNPDSQCDLELSVPKEAIIRIEKWKSAKPPACKIKNVSTVTR